MLHKMPITHMIKNFFYMSMSGMEHLQESPCPVAGLYTGHIPDETSLCARLSSDCQKLEEMHYTVMECGSQQVYEERDYRCLGQWTEGKLVYTYTQRTDASTHECFVGSIDSDQEIWIMEAGEHCQRKVDPLTYGMRLQRRG